MILDNLLWQGRVAEPPADRPDGENTLALREFNRYFMAHPRLEALILPLGDGLGLATKSRPGDFWPDG